MLLAILMECFHMGLTLLIARPFADALAVVKLVVLPMVIANAVGMMVALFLIKNKEEKISTENDAGIISG
jgi:LytS/YehU family sensor histidine kinase